MQSSENVKKYFSDLTTLKFFLQFTEKQKMFMQSTENVKKFHKNLNWVF